MGTLGGFEAPEPILVNGFKCLVDFGALAWSANIWKLRLWTALEWILGSFERLFGRSSVGLGGYGAAALGSRSVVTNQHETKPL